MKRTEICHNCGDNFIPRRRGVQKFCSNSCRSRYWFLKQKENTKIDKLKITPTESVSLTEKKQDKMSFAGVGNATAGSLVADGIKSALTKSENKPATKKDIRELKNLISNRYLPVYNMEKDVYGRSAFYDVQTKHVIYI
ncbi:hypothetical protein EYD45_07500 [Hyunsoonleella flava]|uniref:Uncharacterized protein n=1 Tax=Hyunsoonleella flava TaxID=2527939 RepID=A0A4Q9FGZ6_9FLAO|nr:hypothetical protein [Hyunsoonleella flava]TBN04454.1 hypothetical protein EYD45_07500 [Hyunsoonleella flava]